jgi:pimeloyl-ACP methyl ester carboxylesterase
MAIFLHGGRRLHYLVRGSGAPTLLIHGLGASGADWAFQVPVLEPQFRVIVPDLPGCGHSAAPESGHSIPAMATALWALLDALELQRPNIVGFSLGGAVALEMALQRPESVPRLALINSLASYRIDHWTKWCKARLDASLVCTFGMRRVAPIIAARLFPHAWQRPMRERAQSVISAVPATTYLAMAAALERWTAIERLGTLRSRILMIAAQSDYTPLAEKRELAAQLRANIVVVRGSRHGTPFDSIALTNACLIALLNDRALPVPKSWVCDEPERALPVAPEDSIAAEHAAGP